MTFTDEQLRKLREKIDYDMDIEGEIGAVALPTREFDTLLKRLEAAEWAAGKHGALSGCTCGGCSLWELAVGKI